jgi:hypothetical protein
MSDSRSELGGGIASTHVVPCPRYRPRPSVMFVRHGALTVLLDVDKSRYFSLDETGGRIWELLLDNERVDDLVGAVEAEYSIAAAEARDAVMELLDTLMSARLVDALPTD